MLPTNRKGFTLIELLIVVVIIGILAAIAIPKFANTKEKAYVAAMKSDLKNLATVQESFFADNQTYATNAAAIGAATTYGWVPSGPAASITVNVAGGNDGWGGDITDARVTNAASNQCGIYAGAAARQPAGMPAATPEGVVACW